MATQYFGEGRTADEALEALLSHYAKRLSSKTKKSVIQFIQDWNSLPPQVQVENLQGLGGLKHITNEEAKQIILNNSPGNIPPAKLIAIYSKTLIFINFNYINDMDRLQYYRLYTIRNDTVKSIQGVNWHNGINLNKITNFRGGELWDFYEWDVKSTPFMNWTETPF